MDPLEFLNKKPSMSFDEFKSAFPSFDVTKLKSLYDTFKQPSTQSNTLVGGLLDTLLSSSNIDKMGALATNLGVSATAILSIPKALQGMDFGATFSGLEEEMVSASGLVTKMISGVKDPIKAVKTLFTEDIPNQVNLYFRQQTGLLNEMNGEIGMTGKLSKDFREQITNANPELLRMGIGFSEVVNFTKELVLNSGRFKVMNSETLTEIGEISKAYAGGLSNMSRYISEFEKIGYGNLDTANLIKEIGSDSLALGLRSQSVIEKVNENLSNINRYGFKNGVEGLSKMVQKSTEFRMNMQDVFSIAERTMSLSESLNLTAELQSIGGAIGDFMDPFKIAYMSTENIGGIQDALIDMAKGLAVYNEEQGRFAITGTNLKVARTYADALKMDVKSLTDLAIAGAERQQFHNDLIARGIVLSKDQEEFLANMSTMKDGKMSIELTNEKVIESLNGLKVINRDNLSQPIVDKLIEYQNEFKVTSPKELIRDQATIMQGISRDVAFLAANVRLRGGKYAEMASTVTLYDKGFTKDFGDNVLVKNGMKIIDDSGKLIIKNIKDSFLEKSLGVDLSKKSLETKYDQIYDLEYQRKLSKMMGSEVGKAVVEANTRNNNVKTVVNHNTTINANENKKLHKK